MLSGHAKESIFGVFAAGVNQSPNAEWPWSLETRLGKWVNEVQSQFNQFNDPNN